MRRARLRRSSRGVLPAEVPRAGEFPPYQEILRRGIFLMDPRAVKVLRVAALVALGAALLAYCVLVISRSGGRECFRMGRQHELSSCWSPRKKEPGRYPDGDSRTGLS